MKVMIAFLSLVGLGIASPARDPATSHLLPRARHRLSYCCYKESCTDGVDRDFCKSVTTGIADSCCRQDGFKYCSCNFFGNNCGCVWYVVKMARNAWTTAKIPTIKSGGCDRGRGQGGRGQWRIWPFLFIRALSGTTRYIVQGRLYMRGAVRKPKLWTNNLK